MSSLPFISWFADVLGSNVGCTVLAMAVIFMLKYASLPLLKLHLQHESKLTTSSLFIVIGINTAESRLALGMARDHALPKSELFMKINQRAQTPLNGLLLVAIVEIILGMSYETPISRSL
jgi:amino acid transporter